MTPMPPDPLLVYHITPVANLPSIVSDGRLLADGAILGRGGPAVAIGMPTIKQRRIERCEVKCHPGTKVGDYVPFYFCPRSVMLYVIHQGNHAELTYRGGQDPIVHLVADLREVVRWAEESGRRWAFSLSNAGAAYAEFRDRLDQLDEVDWRAVAANDWRDNAVKEAKQAEFLVQGFVPWHLVHRIGARTAAVAARVLEAIAVSDHRPMVTVEPGWYYPGQGGRAR